MYFRARRRSGSGPTISTVPGFTPGSPASHHPWVVESIKNGWFIIVIPTSWLINVDNTTKSQGFRVLTSIFDDFLNPLHYITLMVCIGSNVCAHIPKPAIKVASCLWCHYISLHHILLLHHPCLVHPHLRDAVVPSSSCTRAVPRPPQRRARFCASSFHHDPR